MLITKNTSQNINFDYHELDLLKNILYNMEILLANSIKYYCYTLIL